MHKYCANCGTQVMVTQKFCTECGAANASYEGIVEGPLQARTKILKELEQATLQKVDELQKLREFQQRIHHIPLTTVPETVAKLQGGYTNAYMEQETIRLQKLEMLVQMEEQKLGIFRNKTEGETIAEPTPQTEVATTIDNPVEEGNTAPEAVAETLYTKAPEPTVEEAKIPTSAPPTPTETTNTASPKRYAFEPINDTPTITSAPVVAIVEEHILPTETTVEIAPPIAAAPIPDEVLLQEVAQLENEQSKHLEHEAILNESATDAVENTVVNEPEPAAIETVEAEYAAIAAAIEPEQELTIPAKEEIIETEAVPQVVENITPPMYTTLEEPLAEVTIPIDEATIAPALEELFPPLETEPIVASYAIEQEPITAPTLPLEETTLKETAHVQVLPQKDREPFKSIKETPNKPATQHGNRTKRWLVAAAAIIVTTAVGIGIGYYYYTPLDNAKLTQIPVTIGNGHEPSPVINTNQEASNQNNIIPASYKDANYIADQWKNLVQLKPIIANDIDHPQYQSISWLAGMHRKLATVDFPSVSSNNNKIPDGPSMLKPIAVVNDSVQWLLLKYCMGHPNEMEDQGTFVALVIEARVLNINTMYNEIVDPTLKAEASDFYKKAVIKFSQGNNKQVVAN